MLFFSRGIIMRYKSFDYSSWIKANVGDKLMSTHQYGTGPPLQDEGRFLMAACGSVVT